MCSEENKQWFLKSIEQTKKREEDKEIPPSLLINLITWMRNKGISDEEIVDCILFICKDNE